MTLRLTLLPVVSIVEDYLYVEYVIFQVPVVTLLLMCHHGRLIIHQRVPQTLQLVYVNASFLINKIVLSMLYHINLRVSHLVAFFHAR
jgi:hypothetical protein